MVERALGAELTQHLGYEKGKDKPEGELCANDRAIVFEDPTGVRFLYDPAHNVTGGDDPRLGTIHLVLLTHIHGDHVGDQKLTAPGAGTCANSERAAAPNSTTAEVAAAKNAVRAGRRCRAGAGDR